MRLKVVSLALGLVMTSCTVGVGQSPGSTPDELAPDTRDPDELVIGSYNFTESKILAQLYASALRDAGFEVVVLDGISSREIMEPALEQGIIDVVPEYQGSLLRFLTGSSESEGSARELHGELLDFLAGRRVSVLAHARAQNQNAFVVRREMAQRLQLREVSDLSGLSSELTFGGPPECASRPFCLLGLQERYGLEFGAVAVLDVGGPLTVKALVGHEIDVGLLFSSDPAIPANELVALGDDKGLQPPENVIPVVGERGVALLGADGLSLLEQISSQLTTPDLIEMNRKVDLAGWGLVEAARSWLETARVGA
jgi:osmoprotectant transport system substrate-binding protein